MQTVLCPWCDKDSYSEDRVAWFGEAECTWCGCKFKKNPEYTIIEKGKGKKVKREW